MKSPKLPLWLLLIVLLLQCQTTTNYTPNVPLTTALQLGAFPVGVNKKPSKSRNGKLKETAPLPQTYTKTNLSNFSLPYIDPSLTVALENQLKLLKRRKQDFTQKFDNIALNLMDLETTIELLLLWQQTYPQGLAEHLNAYQLAGKDGKGNVYFTGYYTPKIKVSKKKNSKYKYPFYQFPKHIESPLPTRKEIDGAGALEGMGLELAYTSKLEDIYYMQLQGSGLVQFTNGAHAYFGFAGTNRRSYSSIGTFIKNNENIPLRNISMEGVKNYLYHHPEMVEPILFTNDSYVFFEEVNSKPIGAGHIPLVEDYSIAVDTDHIPLGACLLAAIPVLNKNGKFSHHEYKFLVAQDVGGRIKGNGHVDVYCGIGERGKDKAMALHHYGQLWLLLPKPSDEIGPVFSEARLAIQ